MSEHINKEHYESFKLWAENQPTRHLPYSRCKKFLSELISCSGAEAELAMAELQQRDKIKIIQLHKNSGRRVFLKPLPALTIEVVRDVWSGSSIATQDVSNICAHVHDRTGHSTSDIEAYLRSLDKEEHAIIEDGFFRWNDDEN